MIKHSFGGDWTTQKLRCLDKYLHAYTKIMSKHFSEYMYIDAFAGTGWLTLKQNEDEDEQSQQPSLLDLLADGSSSEQPETSSSKLKQQLDGSARIALKVEPTFTKYLFIEKSKPRFSELQKLKLEYPEQKIIFKNSDANALIQEICHEYQWMKDGVRAVLFLDPYGMHVSWKTIEVVAKTKAIDLWYLFPIGIALNRLLKNNGRISEANRCRIDTVLGTSDWYELFYETYIEEPNFISEVMGYGQQTHTRKTANFERISQYLNERFSSIFQGVANNPRMLLNSKNNPLYLLCFASANPKGSATAIKIA
ncbi:three-Cys-motif partner protein TcmP [Leptolyngbya sp. FACHB-671]|uniref:three-Cys-motif partner protein TcmP n=1 Tax=Leptolyngbya sp. FACHB-671 TaxID=2692812 RepID=UPI00168570BC|nr:three-Cys-motif partner protein TcmP [Leptolyngbya sp. FACHB-671]MBD2068116.1 three-Cys-motif partner protein TcmP [Leptolyngbya sp. FACHB-671]